MCGLLNDSKDLSHWGDTQIKYKAQFISSFQRIFIIINKRTQFSYFYLAPAWTNSNFSRCCFITECSKATSNPDKTMINPIVIANR